MALQVINVDSIGGGLRVDLTTLDDVLVTQGTTVVSTTTLAIEGLGSGHQAFIDGTVMAVGIGVRLGGGATDSINQLTVGETGVVRSTFSAGAWMIGDDSQVRNHGEIHGESWGVLAQSGINSFVENTGTISHSGSVGAVVFFTTGTNTLVNSGLISSTTDAISALSLGAIELVYNTGVIVGDVRLDLGDDLYDGRSGGVVFGTVFGNNGNDSLSGSDEVDVLNGGFDDDVLIGRGGADVLDGGTGDDEIRGQAGDDVLSGGANIDILSGGTGDDELFGGQNNDFMYGGRDDDMLDGGSGSDFMSAGSGNDKLNGGFGNDTLFGRDGDDELNGDAALDILTGGRGADSFNFTSASHSSNAASDRITDFRSSQDDVIDLSAIDAIAGGGNNAFTFIGTSVFSGTAGELRIGIAGGGANRAVLGDTDGDAVADLRIVVEGVTSLLADDFIL